MRSRPTLPSCCPAQGLMAICGDAVNGGASAAVRRFGTIAARPRCRAPRMLRKLRRWSGFGPNAPGRRRLCATDATGTRHGGATRVTGARHGRDSNATLPRHARASLARGGDAQGSWHGEPSNMTAPEYQVRRCVGQGDALAGDGWSAWRFRMRPRIPTPVSLLRGDRDIHLRAPPETRVPAAADAMLWVRVQARERFVPKITAVPVPADCGRTTRVG